MIRANSRILLVTDGCSELYRTAFLKNKQKQSVKKMRVFTEENAPIPNKTSNVRYVPVSHTTHV